MLCRAPLKGGACICNTLSPLRDDVGELIGDITYTSNLGNLAMEVMDDFFLFFVLGHVATEMIGDDCFKKCYPKDLGFMNLHRSGACHYKKDPLNQLLCK